MPVDKFGRMSDAKTKDTGVSLTYINNNYIRSDGGTPVTGSIDMNGHTLHNVAEPVKQQDVATKDYADYIKSSTQDYVNHMVEKTIQEEVRKKLTKRPQLIMVNSSYTGPLRKDTHQFSFGGVLTPPKTGFSDYKNPGFLIPHSGRIVKLKMKTPIIDDWRLREYFNVKKVDINDFTSGLFKIYNFKSDDSSLPEEIGIFTCKEVFELILKESSDQGFFGFCFDDDLPLFNPVVKEGDVINIMTMVDLEFPVSERASLSPWFEKSEYYQKFGLPYWYNVFLVSILIELDPL